MDVLNQNQISGDGINAVVAGLLKQALEPEANHNDESLSALIESTSRSPFDSYEKPLNVLKMDGVGIMSMGDFSVVTGKAKSRKTFLISCAIAAAATGELVIGKLKGMLPDEKKGVLYFDTEQSDYHLSLVLKRIRTMAHWEEEPSNFYTQALRPMSAKDRLNVIGYALETHYREKGIGLVVIDGIRDLVTSINDEEQASLITSKLMKWSTELECHIIVVLHQNKGDRNPRGHLGTELVNKGQVHLSVTKDDKAKEYSVVAVEDIRGVKEPEPFAFMVGDDAIPILADDFAPSSKRNKKETLNFHYKTDRYIYDIFLDVFKNRDEITYSELETDLNTSHVNLYCLNVGVVKRKELISIGRSKGMITQAGSRKPYKLNKEYVCQVFPSS